MSISGVPDEFEELMPCPACPDGYVWNGNGPTRKLCPVCKGLAAVGYRAAQTEQTSGGTQQRAERAEAVGDAAIKRWTYAEAERDALHQAELTEIYKAAVMAYFGQ